MNCSGAYERWRAVEGWEGIYSVSSCGRIRRDAGGRGTVVGRILSVKRNRKGYGYVDLSRNDRKTRRMIHQLVAVAFLPPRPSPDHHPNHLDTNKLNNHATNLEWATRPENNAHARANGLIPRPSGEKNPRARLSRIDVLAIRGSQESDRKLARHYGVARTTIQAVRTGRNWRELNG